MADRTVTVRLRAESSQYKRELAEAAAATSAFAKTAESSGKEIDRYSGRLRAVADAAMTLGPALIPLSAAAIPALTAGLAGLGAAAGALGVTVLAIQGIGDGLKALDAYQLAPTTENLSKLRIEMEKLGPAGAEFVHFLDGLEPQLSNLQQIARAGLFPGVEDGITSLLTRLPEVQRIVADLAQGMGDLAAEAGDNLAGSKFDAFFQYLETDARPTLEAFAHAAGNIAEGVANLIVAFAPLNRGFTQGLQDATQAFAEWSRGLDSNKGFQHFLDYIRESGPKTMDFLEALVKALAGLVEAAAPYGQVVLPVLTSLANAFAAIANSPIGPPLFTAAAAMIAFNRAAMLTSVATGKLSTSFAGMSKSTMALRGGAGIGLLAFQLTGLNDKLALSSTAMDAMAGAMIGGPWGAAIGGGIGLVQDFQAANDDLEASISKADDAIASFDTSGMQSSLKDLQTQVEAIESTKLFGGGLAQDTKDALSLGSLPLAFANSTGKRIKSLFADMSGSTDDAKAKIGELSDALGHGGVAAHGFGGILSDLNGTLRDTANSAAGLSKALSDLSGWFDKRQALRDYRNGIHDLTAALKNGFQPKDAETLDQVGRNIIQVASAIKDPALKKDFLQGARASLEGLANSGGPKAQAAIQRVIDKMDALGLTHPKPKVGADTSEADSKINDTTQRLRKYGNTVAVSKVDANASAAMGVFNAVQHMLSALDGDTATTYVRTVHQNVFPAGGGRAIGGNADGGTIGGQRHPYGDKVLSMLAPGEEVISNRYGQADRFRADRAAGRIPSYADGGTSGGQSFHNMGGGHGGGGGGGFTATVWTDGVYSAAKALKAFKSELDAASKSLDKEKQKRDALQQQRDEFASAVGSAYATNDPFAALTQSGSPWAAGNGMDPLGAFDKAVSGNIANTQAAQAALATAAAHGLNGPLYQALAQSGNLQLLQSFAGLSTAQIDQREAAFAAQSNAQSALGNSAAATAGMDQSLKDANKELVKIRNEVRTLQHVVKEMDKNNQKGHKDNAKHVTDGVNGAAANGHRRGHSR